MSHSPQVVGGYWTGHSRVTQGRRTSICMGNYNCQYFVTNERYLYTASSAAGVDPEHVSRPSEQNIST